MSVADEALAAALVDADKDTRELEARAYNAVTMVQQRVAQDGGRKVIAAGNKLMALVATWASENEITPGEAALVLSSCVVGTLAVLPGMTAALARAIAIEFARGPRSE